MLKKEKINAYSIIRILATFLVVIGHSTALVIGSEDKIINTYENCQGLFVPNITELIRQIIYSFHMPLFVFLSGVTFFLSINNSTSTFKSFTFKRFVRLIIPYLLVATILFIPVRIYVGYYGDEYSIFSIVFNDIFLGLDINYLWYVVMLFEVNVLMFLFLKYIKVNTTKKKIITLCVFLIISISQYLFGIIPFQIHRTLEFLFWFYLGYLFEENRILLTKFIHKKSVIIFSVFIFVCSFIANYLLLEYASLINFNLLTYLFKAFRMGLRYILGVSAIVVIVSVAFKLKYRKIYNKIDKHSFGIYLYHIPLFYLFVNFISRFISDQYMNNILYLICLLLGFVFSFVGSYFISYVINKQKSDLLYIYEKKLLF